MASITSVISIFVVLFVTYCHAVPIVQQYDVSTSDYEFTTDKPILGRERPVNVELTADEESTVVPRFNEKRTSYEHDSDEYTTPSRFENHDDEFHHKRRYEDASFTTPATDFVSEEPHDVHSFNNHVYNNLETSTEFNKRATRYREGELEENQEKRAQRENELEEDQEKRAQRENELEENQEKRTQRENELKEDREKRAQRENGFETTTDFEFSSSAEPKSFVQPESSSFEPVSSSIEPVSSSVEPESSSVEPESSSIEPESNKFESSSSVDSFGKSTGFLHKYEYEEKPTTPEYEPTTPEYESTTPEYEPTTPEYRPTTPVFKYVRPSVQPPTRFPVNKQRLTQTETIIPGKITETKIFANAPSQTYIVSEPIPVRQSQLNQGRSQSFVKKEVSDN